MVEQSDWKHQQNNQKATMKLSNSKNSLFKSQIHKILAVIIGLQAFSALAGDPGAGKSTAFGKSLAQWQEIYWRWALGQITLPVDRNNNATVGGNVVLMPIPFAPGDGTTGSIDVTLDAGQACMLPLWNILGTSYNDGTPVDPAVSLNLFRTLEISLKIDGVTVISPNNVMNYYTSFSFNPEIPLPLEWSPYLAIVWLQGIGVIQSPLSPGSHIISLDVKNTIPVIDGKGDAYVFEYHNTWNVTVNRGKSSHAASIDLQ